MPRRLHQLAGGRGDGSYPRLDTRLAKLDMLAIDDWRLRPRCHAERRDRSKVIEDGTKRASTPTASQLLVSDWHAVIGDRNRAAAAAPSRGAGRAAERRARQEDAVAWPAFFEGLDGGQACLDRWERRWTDTRTKSAIRGVRGRALETAWRRQYIRRSEDVEESDGVRRMWAITWYIT